MLAYYTPSKTKCSNLNAFSIKFEIVCQHFYHCYSFSLPNSEMQNAMLTQYLKT